MTLQRSKRRSISSDGGIRAPMRERGAVRALCGAIVVAAALALAACHLFQNPVDPGSSDYSGSSGRHKPGGGSGGSGTPSGAATDTTPPNTSSMTVTSSMTDSTHVKVVWTAASDDTTTPANIEYKVVWSSSPVDTVTVADALTGNAVGCDWAKISTCSVNVSTGTWGTTYYFGVLARDQANNESLYGATTVSRVLELYDVIAVATDGTYVFLNDGTGKLTATSASPYYVGSTTSAYSGVALANLTSHAASGPSGAPNIEDVFVTNNDIGPNSVWKSDGSGGLAQITQTDSNWVTSPSTAVALGTIQSGDTGDAFVVNYNAPDTVWTNDGSGVFAERSETNLSGFAAVPGHSVAMGNIVALGGSAGDVFEANTDTTSSTLKNRVWENVTSLNQYSGTTQTNIVAMDTSVGVALADLNADGYLDAVVANLSGTSYVYLNSNTGSGIFNAPATLSTGNGTAGVALGLLNNDSYPDALFVNKTAPDTVWLNNGDGTFTQESSTGLTTSDEGECVALGDLNGDGKVDAVVGTGGVSGTLHVLLGNGDGTFSEITQTSIPADTYVAVAIGRLR